MSTRFSPSMGMSRLTRDGTAEPVSRDEVLNEDREIFIFPVQLATGRIGNLTRFILTLAICDDHTKDPKPSTAKADSYRIEKSIRKKNGIHHKP